MRKTKVLLPERIILAWNLIIYIYFYNIQVRSVSDIEHNKIVSHYQDSTIRVKFAEMALL